MVTVMSSVSFGVREPNSMKDGRGHVNNQFNICFWMLVKSGKTRSQAQKFLEGTRTSEKNELLFQQFGMNYNTLPAIFRKGSCVFRDKVEEAVKLDNIGNPIKRSRKKVRVEHCDIIGEEFWNKHLDILVED
uniref:Putative tRNA(His) guanylyltransferase n=1 Tax=Anthurium amnicola TaxID=1678845 RepID=A0A1D1Y4H8_9ARAE